MMLKVKVMMEKQLKKPVMVSLTFKILMTQTCGETSLLNMLMTENLDARNFIHIIHIAGTVPTTQSGKKRIFTVTTMEFPKQTTRPYF